MEKLNSWLEIDEDSDFSMMNIPFGIFRHPDGETRGATRLGDYLIDLSVLAQEGYFDDCGISERTIFNHKVLNPFMELGRVVAAKVRMRIQELFSSSNALKGNREFREKLLFHAGEVEMLMPVEVGDYTDFYSSKEHATNVGTMFRDPDNALLPNWLHLPVGYHGRSSSIVVSGTPIHRPKGQTKPDDHDKPVFGPCRLLDFELEMAFITCTNTRMGQSISTEDADKHIWGMVLFNDWSARDIQKWEYVPLGPFLAKNFASSISPWVITLDALEPYRTTGPVQEPEVLPYLKCTGKKNYDIELEVEIQPEAGEGKVVCRSNFKYMYWNMNQQLAHHTVNGCNIRVGDMYASGTISGPTPDSFGSMLEISWKGTRPVEMPDGSERKFILDGDTVVMRGSAGKQGEKVGFGEVRTKVLPAK